MTGRRRPTSRLAFGSFRARSFFGLALALGLAASFALGYRDEGRGSMRGAPHCECPPPPPPRQALEAETAVFDGTVARIAQEAGAGSVGSLAVTFVVHTQWKGVSRSPVTLRTLDSDTACGYRFRLGQRYLVYASGSVDDLRTSTCSRTRLYDAAEARELGPNEPPADAIPHPIWSALPPLACPDCAPSLPPLEALAQADAVWHGQPLSIADLGPAERHDHQVVYRNLGWWKGDAAPTVSVRIPYSVFACDPWLWMQDRAPGLPSWREHLVFAMRAPGGGWELRLCGQTRFYDAAEAAMLGPPKPSATSEPSVSPTVAATEPPTGTVVAPTEPGTTETVPPPTETVPPPTEPASSATATASPAAATPTPPGERTATPVVCPTMECPGCPGPRPVRDWLDEADAVFLGRVRGVVRVGCDHRVAFQVLERFKGPLGAQAEVFVGMMSWQCMRRYEAGAVDVVFARAGGPDGLLQIPMCFGITDGDALAELRALGTPAPGPDLLLLPRLTRP